MSSLDAPGSTQIGENPKMAKCREQHYASDQASDQADKLLQFCAIPRSIKEIMQHLGLSHRTYFRKTFLQPLIDSGKLLQLSPIYLPAPINGILPAG